MAIVEFPHSPARFLAGEERARAVKCLRTYYAEYSGAWFERLSDLAHPFLFTASDFVAVSTLGVIVPPRVAIWLLEGAGREAAASLLTAIPVGVPIWEATDEILDEGSPAHQLWELLQERQWGRPDRANGVGPVTAGKLLAAKRPDLVPIWDQWVDDALGRVDNFWLAIRYALMDTSFRAILAETRDEADLPSTPSLLRILDIVVWMRHYGHGESGDDTVRDMPPVSLP